MSEYIKKLITLNRQLQIPTLQKQVAEIEQIEQIIQQKGLLEHAPAKLGISADQFWQLSEFLSSKQQNKLKIANKLLNSFRQYLSLSYGIWSIPNKRTAQLIKEKYHAVSALEVMAGNGYWSFALKQVGVHAEATDSLRWAQSSQTGNFRFLPVCQLNAIKAVKQSQQFDLIICSWAPNFGNSDLALVQAWRKYQSNAHLLFIGDKEGTTNSPQFWKKCSFCQSPKLKEINQSFSSFDFINENIFEVRL